jgi:hypothetical protein
LRKTLLTTVLALLSAQVLAECPPSRPRVMVERFISADCEACWRDATPLAQASSFVLDWIVPSARGSEAPLAIGAVLDASERAGALPPDRTLLRDTALSTRSPLRLTVGDGPAMNGYFGVDLEARWVSKQRLPAGLVGYIAVVERIAAGSEGTPVARQLVRNLIGPIPLAGLQATHPFSEYRASRLPENAQPERLTVVGWVQSAEGQVLATANARYAGCGVKATH